jgi:Ni,Fe-hydrogenase III large subunit/NADH:ubiquinone oxidoreductase subunit C
MNLKTNHQNVRLTKLDDLPTYDYTEFRTRLQQHLSGNGRLVSFFGAPTPNSDLPLLHAVFLTKDKELIHFRGRLQSGESCDSLTVDFPEMHCFEREVHEQYGIEFTGHPWLKPIRFEGRSLEQMNEYPFYKLKGKEVHEVAVGPIHAGVIEPGHFRFMCFGEKVYHLEIHHGYQHRGVERLLLKTKQRHLPPLIESTVGDSAVAYALAHCRAWEALCDLDTSDDVERIRSIGLELERLAMHLGGLSGMATDIAFLPGSASYGRLRTTVINLSMRLCGSRFGRSWFRPGELRFPFAQSHRDDIRKSLELVQHDIAYINKSFTESRTVNHRLRGIGSVSNSVATEIGLVGLMSRACGMSRDLRTELCGGAYEDNPMSLVSEPTGDCWARAMVRIREIESSINWVMALSDTTHDVSAEQPPTSPTPQPNSGVISVEEGWRGEVMQYIETDENGNIVHYKVQDPSLRNWFGLAQAVKDNTIYDFPICNKSFDMSYCGNDL